MSLKVIDIITYNILLNALVNNNEMNTALLVFTKIIIQVDLITYNTLFKGIKKVLSNQLLIRNNRTINNKLLSDIYMYCYHYSKIILDEIPNNNNENLNILFNNKTIEIYT